MAGKGAYIVLGREDAKELFAQKEDPGVRKTIEQLLKSPRHREDGLIFECGEAWDPIHRALTEGTLDPEAGEFPLDHCVLGGKRLHEGADFEVVLIRPDIAPHVAKALHDLRRQDFHDNYMKLDPADYGKTPTETESDEVWATLKLIRQVFEDAADAHAAVVFTVAR